MHRNEELTALMVRYQQGDPLAVNELVQTLSPQLYRFFQSQFVSRRFADDLLQETWLKIHEVRHTYRSTEPVLPWIYAIARHTRVDHYRKTRRVEDREQQVEVLPDRPVPPARESQGPDLDAMLRVLPDSQRDVVLMLKVGDMSLEEVARATSSSIGSVKQKAHRAYEKLRGLL
jgi:RNA polymerase sigma-70 factor (ECF subfamily)